MYFSGIQPTGKLHIGNYLGAIKNWVKLQKPENTNIYCIVDLHALTDKLKSDHVNNSFSQNTHSDTLNLAATLIASGINPKKSILFVQSHVPQHAELQWMLSCIAPQNWLNKMTQYKQKKNSNSTLGLFTYPVLMAADIILYQAQQVPVGRDQKQHVELTRDYTQRLNSLFNLNLVMPEYIESTTPKIMSLKDATKKMSKSDPNDFTRINIEDTKEEIYKKIQKATTDSIAQLFYNEESRPELSNLLSIYREFSGLSIEQIEEKYSTSSIVEFKQDLAGLIHTELHPIAEKAQYILQNEGELLDVLNEGSQQAEKIASKNIKIFKKAMGLLI